ncbi:MAG: penicillin-binding transpeptidase domain-containing protein, partial [Bacteroidia bacterium]|nr:penicillin-binding transpeptidase domain-containing protein [Bacteroidia bacterium]
FGGNIEGVEAAARLYFQKSVWALSPAQLATLCVLPNRPNGLRPDRNAAALLHARNRWLEKFKTAGIWSEEVVEIAKLEPLTARRRRLSSLAPHFCRTLVETADDPKRIVSTLDAPLQKRVEDKVDNYVRRIRVYGISNATAVVVENANRAVRAYVGSADFDDAQASGQVDGAAAVRSPGSALKPLIYALAVEKGLNPKRMLLDAPTNFGGFWPENYDRRCRGPVRAEDALAFSLNVPAVAVLNEIGVDAFVRALTTAGFAQVKKDAKKLGLAAALGGCGVRAIEMAGLYAALADGGKFRPLRKLVSEPLGSSVVLFSPGTAWIVGEALRRRDRPDLPAAWVESADAPPV